MAIQARLYSENLTFPFINNEGGDFRGDANLSQHMIENTRCLNGFYLFNLQQQQQQYQQSQHPLGNQDSYVDTGFNKPISTCSSSLIRNMHKQNQEIEGFISLQNDTLRLALQAKRKQQLLTILESYELKSELLLRQKDEEIKRATKRRIELEGFLRRTDMERQRWQIAANETEAMVINLNHTIEQLSEKLKTGVEDEGSCCHDNGDKMKKMVCRSCFNEESCVMMLPCRHLCACESCDVFLHTCPVCKMVKKASIQVSRFDSSL